MEKKEYQIYAYDKNGRLNHCGPESICGPVTIKKCKRLETDWRRWRREYLKTHPGNYPLRRHSRKTIAYIMNEIGKTQTFTVNLV